MRIAYIVPYVPNLIRTRPFNLIGQLSALGHTVSVFTLGSSKQDSRDAQLLMSRCAEVHYQTQPIVNSLLSCAAALPSHRPLQAVYSWNLRFAERMKNLLFGRESFAAFDVVHVEHLRGSQYGRYIKANAPGIPVVWDSVDCISHLFRQASNQSGSAFSKLITSFELKRTEKAEGELMSVFDHVLVTSEIDKKAMLDLVPDGLYPAPISVLSNGVDLEYYRPRQDIQRDPETLVFSGKMSYHANISMVKYLVAEIMPKVWQRRPGTRLVIVGKDPSADVQNLTRNPLVTVTGTVDDIRPYLWKATVAVVPLVYGAGIQNKILEAMACGIPVVTTLRTTSSLQATPGQDILVADNPDVFASMVLQLIEGPHLQREIGNSGFRYVQKYHNWKQIALDLIRIYQKVN